MDKREEFIALYSEYITREGSEALLEYLSSPACDFFSAPASARFHGNYDGGLCEHSVNVFNCLTDYLDRPKVAEEYGLRPEEESVAIVSLLHDLCKIGCYKQYMRNVKNESGVWTQVPAYEFSDPLPYGHGEKSVYIISGFMKLTREEAFAIRYHMGFSGEEDKRNIGAAFEKFPLSFALSVADMEATFFIESKI